MRAPAAHARQSQDDLLVVLARFTGIPLTPRKPNESGGPT